MPHSSTITKLLESNDPIDNRVAKALIALQNSRSARGLARNLGYEPRDIEKFGTIEVIERRIQSASSGFEEVGPEDSYEAIVVESPDRFSPEIVTLAQTRLN